MNCRKCNRPLSNPNSIRAGIGPICAARVETEAGQLQLNYNNFTREDVEWAKSRGWEEGDFFFRRTSDGAHTNVQHRIVRHSPTGLEWGYGGSGPADTALNILAEVEGKESPRSDYQDFKFKFIANLSQEGGVIKRKDINKWLEAEGK